VNLRQGLGLVDQPVVLKLELTGAHAPSCYGEGKLTVTSPRGRGEPRGAHQWRRNNGAVTDLVGDELEKWRWFGLRRRGDMGGGMVKLMVKMSVRKQGRGVAAFYRGGEGRRPAGRWR
jgi:hypothetical protein